MVKLYFLMTINIFMYICIGKNAHWDIYAPPLQIITQNFFSFFFIFFNFRCILLQLSHKKCFFISISILGRSGVSTYYQMIKTKKQTEDKLYTTIYVS